MANFDKLEVNQVLWTVTKERMGNTMVKTVRIHTAKVVELDMDNRRALISWNGNRPRWVSEYHLKNYRVNRPLTITNKMMGYERLMTREERKLHKEGKL